MDKALSFEELLFTRRAQDPALASIFDWVHFSDEDGKPLKKNRLLALSEKQLGSSFDPVDAYEYCAVRAGERLRDKSLNPDTAVGYLLVVWGRLLTDYVRFKQGRTASSRRRVLEVGLDEAQDLVAAEQEQEGAKALLERLLESLFTDRASEERNDGLKLSRRILLVGQPNLALSAGMTAAVLNAAKSSNDKKQREIALCRAEAGVPLLNERLVSVAEQIVWMEKKPTAVAKTMRISVAAISQATAKFNARIVTGAVLGGLFDAAS